MINYNNNIYSDLRGDIVGSVREREGINLPESRFKLYTSSILCLTFFAFSDLPTAAEVRAFMSQPDILSRLTQLDPDER